MATTLSKQTEIIANLQSTDAKIVKKGITTLKKEGTQSILPEIITLFCNTKNTTLKEELKSVLFQLKIENAASFLIQHIKKEEDNINIIVLLSAIWESGLDASSHLIDLIEIAIKSEDYLIVLEVLTIIENIDGGLNDSVLTEGITLLQGELQWKKTDNDQLLASIVKVLQNFIID